MCVAGGGGGGGVRGGGCMRVWVGWWNVCVGGGGGGGGVCVCVCVCVVSFPYSQALLPPSEVCLRTCAFINLTHLFLEIRGGKRGASETVWPAGALREHAQLLRVKNVSTTALWLLNSKPSPATSAQDSL